MRTKPETQWLDSVWTFLAAVAVAGPLALPLLWRNPRLSRKKKALWTAGVLLLTGLLLWGSGEFAVRLRDQLNTLQNARQLQENP